MSSGEGKRTSPAGRMTRRRFLALVGSSTTGLLVIAACAPQAPPAATAPPATRAPAPTAPPAVKATPAAKAAPRQRMSVAFNRQITAFGNLGRRDTEQTGLVAAGLARQDPATYQWHPQMAEELPSVQKGTGQIDQARKTMVTTYKLRPNLRWHDGTPFSARDFVFGYEVHTHPKFPTVDKVAYKNIEKMEAPDDRTLVIHWKSLYKRAGSLDKQDIQPMPRHLFEAQFRAGDIEAIEKSAYHNRQFIGTGPYKIVEYGDGSTVRLEAFADYALGKPVIPSLVKRVITDGNAALAGVLAGEIDVSLRSTVKIDGAVQLKETWERQGKGTVHITPAGLVWLNLTNTNPLFKDVRVRQALLHAIDRDAIVKNLFRGFVPVAHAPSTTVRPQWARAEKVVKTYPYDPERARRLLGELGWRPGPDGVLVNEQGQRFTFESRTASDNKERTQVQAAIHDYWKKIGVEVTVNNQPDRVWNSEEYRNRWPGAFLDSHNYSVDEWAERWHSRNIPTEANRWVPENSHRWSNPKADAIMDELDTIIPPEREDELIVEFLKLWTDELPSLPLYHNSDITTVVQGITRVTPRGDTGAYPIITWNIHEWGL